MGMAESRVPLGLEPPEVLPSLGQRQLQCLRFLAEYVTLRREYPTYSEIAGHLDVSRAQAGRYLDQLERKGYIARERGKHARNVRVTAAGMRKLAIENPEQLNQLKLFDAKLENKNSDSR